MAPMRRSAQDFEYVVVVQMQGMHSTNEDSHIERTNNLHLIPSSSGNISIGSYVHFDYPLYFRLPKQFLGDKVSSYAGHLQFSVATERCNRTLSIDVLAKYPLVQIHAYDSLVLDYYGVSGGFYSFSNEGSFNCSLFSA